MIAYEQLLNQDVQWALREGSMHFEKESAVHKTLERIAHKLEQTGVPYALAGGMALFFHGYRRFTEDIDIIVQRDDLRKIHEQLVGLGYLPLFEGSKNLRDTQTGVRIEFLISGDYPGDGRPKPVRFPDPAAEHESISGVQCVPLPRLIELKLVSGAVPGRRRDWADVQEMIRILVLPIDLANQLDASVRDVYLQLWNEVQQSPPPP